MYLLEGSIFCRSAAFMLICVAEQFGVQIRAIDIGVVDVTLLSQALVNAGLTTVQGGAITLLSEISLYRADPIFTPFTCSKPVALADVTQLEASMAASFELVLTGIIYLFTKVCFYIIPYVIILDTDSDLRLGSIIVGLECISK